MLSTISEQCIVKTGRVSSLTWSASSKRWARPWGQVEAALPWHNVSTPPAVVPSPSLIRTSPNVLALNWASTIVQSLLFLLIFMAISTCLLWYFYRCTARVAELKRAEGLQRPDTRAYGRAIVPVTFLLAVAYLPLSTMAVHVLVWSKDLWVVQLPNLGGKSWPPDVEALGPEDEYWGPLEFCWTTTMKRNEINWAPALILLAVIVSFVVRSLPLECASQLIRRLTSVPAYDLVSSPIAQGHQAVRAQG